jgi:hypothetical protein
MSSVWGSAWWFAFNGLDSVYLWPLFCILVAGTIRLFMLIGNYDVMKTE